MGVYDGQKTEALDLSSTLCDNKGTGLLGVTVDPAFDSTAPGDDYVYLFHN